MGMRVSKVKSNSTAPQQCPRRHCRLGFFKTACRVVPYLLGDSDSDGFTLLEEFLLGGDPATSDGASIQPLHASENGYLVLRWRERVSKGDTSLVAISTSSLKPDAIRTALTSTDAADQSGIPEGFVLREAKIEILGNTGFIWLKVSLE